MCWPFPVCWTGCGRLIKPKTPHMKFTICLVHHSGLSLLELHLFYIQNAWVMDTWNFCTKDLPIPLQRPLHRWEVILWRNHRYYSERWQQIFDKCLWNMALKLVAQFAGGSIESLYHQQQFLVQTTPSWDCRCKKKVAKSWWVYSGLVACDSVHWWKHFIQRCLSLLPTPILPTVSW